MYIQDINNIKLVQLNVNDGTTTFYDVKPRTTKISKIYVYNNTLYVSYENSKIIDKFVIQ